MCYALFVETSATDALYEVSLTAQHHYEYNYKGIRLEKATIYGKQVQQNEASSTALQKTYPNAAVLVKIRILNMTLNRNLRNLG